MFSFFSLLLLKCFIIPYFIPLLAAEWKIEMTR